MKYAAAYCFYFLNLLLYAKAFRRWSETRRRRVLLRQWACVWMGNTEGGEKGLESALINRLTFYFKLFNSNKILSHIFGNFFYIHYF